MDHQLLNDKIKNKHILVTGGTGTFGQQIVQQLIKYGPASINIFSRDEKKQYDMQQKFKNIDVLHFLLGDVRDYERLSETIQGIDIIFHAAALKQVPNCEFAPYEAVLTNIKGAENVRRASIKAGVKKVISISTDKAVKPVNVMGMTKSIQERIMLQALYGNTSTEFVCVRYGNVLGSRGSVVPLFYNCILNNQPLPVTHPDMNRFQLILNDAVELVLWALVNGTHGDLWVKKMPSANTLTLGKVLAYGLTGNKDYPVEIIGARPGEKMYEVLVSEEEMWRAKEQDEYFIIPSWERSYQKLGPTKEPFKEYASNKVHIMSEDEIFNMFQRDGWFDKT